ncbi:MAG: hypothetical protein NTV22_11560 [bacterium]|nr:hypothetical protein [bacterium]
MSKHEQSISIDDAEKTICDFLHKKLGRDAKITRLEKTEQGWIGVAEVFEESSFIKSLGLATKVQDKNIYQVTLNNALEVVGYKLKKENVDDEALGDKNG